MRPPFRMVHDVYSHETIEVLEELLRQAKEGQILGIAFVAMRKGRKFVGDAAGEAYRNPVFTRGMIAELNDYLGKL